MSITTHLGQRLSLRSLRSLMRGLGACWLLCSVTVLVTLSLAEEAPAQHIGKERPARERVAVLTLLNRIDMSREETSYLTGLVRRVASKHLSQKYLVMTQENIEVLLPPETKLEDCVSECQVETGRMIGARFIITGEVLRFGSSLRLTLRMHDTKTGQLIAGEVVKAKTIEGLEDPTERVVEALLRSIQARGVTKTKAEPSKDEVIIVGGTGDQTKSRRERLRERARLAFEETEARRERRAQERRAQERRAQERRAQERRAQERRAQERRAQERRAQERRAQRAQSAKASDLTYDPIGAELYFGLGQGVCETGGVNCEDQGLNSDISLALGMRYFLNEGESAQRWGWRNGLELKYAHSSLSTVSSSTFEHLNLSYTVNYVNLSYLFSYEAGWLNLSANVGLGVSSGLYSVIDYGSSSESSIRQLEFQDELNLNLGASLGIRLTPNWMVSVYTDRFRPAGEVNLCERLSGECNPGQLPEVTQGGLRLAFTM